MKRLLFLAALLAGCTTSPARVDEPTGPTRTHWPADWEGEWTGTLQIEGGRPMDPVAFSLEIGPLDDQGDRPWRLTYGATPTRDYRLVTQDAEAGLYAVDEQNDIVLDARLIGDTFVSAFAVGGSILVTHQRFGEDRIEHEIMTFARSSESTGRDVATHAVQGRQYATLRPAGQDGAPGAPAE